MPLAVNSDGCVRTSCRGRGGGKRCSSKVINLLFYCSSSFSLSVQTAQYELALPQDSLFHAKCISKCFAKIKCSNRTLNRETGRQKRSFERRFEKKVKEQQSRKMHGESSDGENTKKPLQSQFNCWVFFNAVQSAGSVSQSGRLKVWLVLCMGMVASEVLAWKGHVEVTRLG